MDSPLSEAEVQPNAGRRRPLSRREFLSRGVKVGLLGGAGLTLYSGEIERHWIEVTDIDIAVRGLPEALEGVRIAQLSDIHMDEFTEETFLRRAVEKINALKPDMVALTGDFVTLAPMGPKFAIGAAWQCADVLKKIKCRHRYAVMGNHDDLVGKDEVTESLTANGIPVLDNAGLLVEGLGAQSGRLWLAGVDDPLTGRPRPDDAMAGRSAGDPVVMMCHGPDYADDVVDGLPPGSVDLMLSGHTHGGQVRLPMLTRVMLPEMGRKYVEGLFRMGTMQLYVNRGIGTVGVPFRFACPPEISVITLRRA